MNPEEVVTEVGEGHSPPPDITSSKIDRASSFDVHQLVSDVGDKGLILPHEQQQFNWDCGIACLRMVSFIDSITS